jgi:hypothetical protein
VAGRPRGAKRWRRTMRAQRTGAVSRGGFRFRVRFGSLPRRKRLPLVALRLRYVKCQMLVGRHAREQSPVPI